MSKEKPVFDSNTLPKELRKIYNETVKVEHKSIVDRLLTLKENETLDITQRPRPNYMEGSVDEMMFPIHPKAKDLLERVMKGLGYIYVLEGGARGGKDVFALLIWTIYLMTTPHKTHLALGKSLEHALLTILHSDGFGLYYTIPNGVFVRNSDSGAQRGIYKFKDIYGMDKEVLFYGNEKKNDNEKYQGFTIGSTYVNEGMTQHLEGINQAKQRMFSSHNHLMLITQNPKGQAHPFYTDFEKGHLFTNEEVELTEYIRTRYENDFRLLEKEILDKAEVDKKDYVKRFCEIKSVPSPKYLAQEDVMGLRKGIRDIDFHYDKMIAGLTVESFYKDLHKDHKLYGLSMRKVVGYNRGGDNPNGVINAYDYTYYHFTVDDNVALTEMQRNEAKKTFKKGSALYLQKTLGIRKTAEKAAYKEFSYKNVIEIGLHDFDNSTQTMRVIGIDPGLNHETGILDCEIDFRTGTTYVIQERLIDYKNQSATVGDIEQAFWDVVRARKYRKFDVVIIDPSHLATINHFESKGISVTPANNSSLMTRNKEKKYMNLNQQKDLMGVDLLKYAFEIGKIFINGECVNVISQIESNEFEYDENTGKIKVKKVNDDVLDVLRYVVNTMIGGTQYWEKGGEIDGENALQEILGNEGTKKEEWNMDKILARAQREIIRETKGDAIFGNADDGSGLFDERDDGFWFLGNGRF